MSLTRPTSVASASIPTTTGRSSGDRHYDPLLGKDYVLTGGQFVQIGGSGAAVKMSIGSGLPGFGGRSNGDLHYDTATGKMHVMTGASGGTLQDDFERANQNIVNGSAAPTGQTYTKANSATATDIQIVNGKLVFTTGGPGLTFPIGAGDVTAAIEWTPATQSGASSVGFSLGGWGTSVGYSTYDGWFIYRLGNRGYVNTRYAGYAADISPGTPIIVTINRTGNVLTLTYTRKSDNALIFSDTYTMTSGEAAAFGSSGYCATSSNGSTLDNLIAYANGTLAWTYTDPVYLSGIVGGALTVANNVLKPGLRVPTATTLRSVVCRLDTAPVGAALTVQVERFNNGVSQGVIGTVTVAAGSTVGSVTGLSAALAGGDILKFNVTTVGSSTPGADLLVSLDCW